MRALAYLASYPRSGNTYLRALLANYFSDVERPLAAQEIAHFGFGEHEEHLLAKFSGLPAGERTVEDQWMARGQYFRALRGVPGSGPVFVKTHTLSGEVFGLPAFEFQADDRVVYLLRHPLDVAVSGADFFKIDQRHMAARMLLEGATNHSAHMYFEITGSWLENVGGWLTQTSAPLLVVHFEDLCARPAVELGRILAFLDEPAPPHHLERAARNATLAHLKVSQQTDGFYQGPGRDPRAPFFRQGRPGVWKTDLDPDIAAHLSEALAEPMRLLGYGASMQQAAGLR